jgi:hypothetical protein
MGAHAPIATLGIAGRLKACLLIAGLLLLLVSPLIHPGHMAHLLIGRWRRGVGSKNLRFRTVEMTGAEPFGAVMVEGSLCAPCIPAKLP